MSGIDVKGRLQRIDQIIQAFGAVNDASATVDAFVSTLTSSTNDYYNGQLLIFISGNLAAQARTIIDYVGSTKQVIVHPSLTTAPANGDRFIVVTAHYTGELRTGSKGLEQIYDLVDQIFTLKRVGDTITTDGTEQNLYIVDNPDFPFHPTKLIIDVTNMVAGDSIQIKEYYRLKSGGSYIRKMTYSYVDNEDPPLKVIELEPNTYGVKITITRVLGTDRAYDYEVYFNER